MTNLYATSIPAGTELSIRLRSSVSSAASRPGDPVEAVTIAPVMLNRSEPLPAGVPVRGSVVRAEHKTKPQGRAALQLRFDSWRDGCDQWRSLGARLSGVDNARESVDQDGAIVGVSPVKSRPGKVEDLLLLAAHAHPFVLAAVLGVKLALHHVDHPQIEYGKGVEAKLVLTSPLEVPADCVPKGAPTGEVMAPSSAVQALVDSLPLRTTAGSPPRPSDLTNLVFVGNEPDLASAFTDAGWSTALALRLRTEVKTFLAVAERHAYVEGPVSILRLNGQAPDLVFQKQNDTFAKRHHVRLWRTKESLDGRPVWVGAATHDAGIRFSPEARTFTHAVEAKVDREREKIVADLRFTGRVSAVAWIARPNVPRIFSNATGDSLETDGRLAVIFLAPTPTAGSQPE